MQSILASILHSIRPGLERQAAEQTDAELLARFTRTRDALSFEHLFWRHGPMVRGVCGRLLADPADAEDAFQAVFVILDRKAESLGRSTSLAGWLHRTAWRTALNARRSRVRRKGHEASASKPEAAFNDPSRRTISLETIEEIDAAIARLPERYRDAFILCELENRLRESAARELGIPLGTLDSRLGRAKKRLRDRLRVLVLPSLAAVTPALAGAGPLLNQSVSPAVLQLAAGFGLFAFKKTLLAVSAAVVLLAGTTYGVVVAQGGKEEKQEAKAKPSIPKLPLYIDPDGTPLPSGALARLGSQRFLQGGEICGLAYSADGKLLASACLDPADPTARVWDAETGKELLRVPLVTEADEFGRSNQPDIALHFTNDGKQLYIVDRVTFRKWDLGTGKQTASHDLQEAVDRKLASAAFSPDGKQVVLAWQNGSLELRSTADFAAIRTGTHPFEGYIRFGISFSPDGKKFLLDMATQKPLSVFDASTLASVLEVPVPKEGQIRQARFMPDGSAIVMMIAGKAQEPFELHVVDASNGRTLRTGKVDWTAGCIAVAPDGKSILVGNYQRKYMEMFDAATLKETGRFPADPSMFRLVVSPSGKRVAGSQGYCGKVSVWNFETREFLPFADPERFYGMDFSPDGKHVLLDMEAGRPRVDWRTGTATRTEPIVATDMIDFVDAYHPDGMHKVVRHRDVKDPASWGRLNWVECSTGKVVRSFEGHKDFVACISISKDGVRMATGGQDRKIFVWDIATAKLVAKFEPAGLSGHEQLLLSSDGKRLVACDSQNHSESGNRITIWEVDSGRQLARFVAPSRSFAALAISPDGKLLAGGAGKVTEELKEKRGMVQIWDAFSGKLLHELPGHANVSTHPGSYCDFSPDGRLVATGDTQGKLRLWETATGKEAHAFVGHSSTVSPRFSPDGKLLLAVSQDAPCYIWEVIPAKATEIDPETAWKDLGDADAKKAFQAVRALAANPTAAVELLRTRLKKIELDEKKVGQWIADLESPRFATREAATGELSALAPMIEARLRKVKEAASTDARIRMDKILENVSVLPPGHLRQLRALQALEYIGTPEAKKIIDSVK